MLFEPLNFSVYIHLAELHRCKYEIPGQIADSFAKNLTFLAFREAQCRDRTIYLKRRRSIAGYTDCIRVGANVEQWFCVRQLRTKLVKF